MQPIDILALPEVRSADRLRRHILRGRRPHEMDVVGHQATAKYVDAEALAVLAQEFAVRTAVVINAEEILAVVAALNNAVRLTRYDDSGHARHANELALADRKVIKQLTVPLCCPSSRTRVTVRSSASHYKRNISEDTSPHRRGGSRSPRPSLP